MFTKPLSNLILTKRQRPLITHINEAGLGNGLRLCLDAGDIQSAPGGATSWLDRTVGGYDFFRGTTSGADATDPTFNGSPGNLSKNEYFSFDGGDFFTYDTTNETWMQNIHKDNALFTIAGWVFMGSVGVGNQGICGTRGTASNTGFVIFVDTSPNILYSLHNAGTTVLTFTSAALIVSGAWFFFAFSVNEAAATGICQTNAVQELFTSTYVLPAAINASFTMQIGSRGNADVPLPNLSRIGQFAVWDVALSRNELMNIYNRTRTRYGV